MNRDRNALKAGIFIVFSFVAAAAAILLINGQRGGSKQVRTVAFTLADDLGGLAVGDDIRVGGYKVGVVRDIHVDNADSPAAKVLVAFTLPAELILREDSQLGVQLSITGQPNLNIMAIGTGKPLPPGTALAGVSDPKTALLAALGHLTPAPRQSSKASRRRPCRRSTKRSIRPRPSSAMWIVRLILRLNGTAWLPRAPVK